MYMSALEGKGVEGGWVKFKDTWWEVFVVGSSFWPVANMVNFKYVKPQYRLVYLNVAGLAWNSYLSYQNQRSNVAHPVARGRGDDDDDDDDARPRQGGLIPSVLEGVCAIIYHVDRDCTR